MHVAALDDIVASKEFADRAKDHDALAELRDLLHGAGPEDRLAAKSPRPPESDTDGDP